MKFSRLDGLVAVTAILGAAALLSLFALDIRADSGRRDGARLGVLTFKRMAVTRRGGSSLSWERMRSGEAVYDSDLVRTGELSEASIFFDGDESSMDLVANTMIKLDFGGPTRDLELLAGRVNLASGGGSGETVYRISGTAGKISLAPGTRISADMASDILSLEVREGQARLEKTDGTTLTVNRYQELRVDVHNGTSSVVERPIVAVSPEGDSRFILFDGGSAVGAIGFAWLSSARSPAAGGRGKSAYTLELSRREDFSESRTVDTDSTSLSLDLEPGHWYWRVRDLGGQESARRELSLNLVKAPALYSPAAGARYQFRRIKPTLSFSWDRMDEASSYLLEVSATPAFSNPELRLRTSETNLSVNSLGEGSWYWRVTPLHSLTVVGAMPNIEQRAFTVVKSAEMRAPSLNYPIEASLYQIQDLEAKSLAFSWQPMDEALSYQFILSASSDLSAPLLRVDSRTPYLSLKGEAAGALRKAGKYYWGLRWKDGEGNYSPLSRSRAITGIDGSIAMRLTFPPDGYRIDSSLTEATRFGWKSNIPARTLFLVSTDQEFKSLAYQEEARTENCLGRAWKPGHYFWRLRAFNVDGSVFLDTPPRSFDVVEPFPPPKLLNPGPGGMVYARDGEVLKLGWSPVDGADYYSLSLHSGPDSLASPLMERGSVAGQEFPLDVGGLASGSYRLSLRAFASAGELTTRILGYSGDAEFSVYHLTDIKLLSPQDGAHVAGLDARYGRLGLSYEAPPLAASTEVWLSEDREGERPIARLATKGGLSRQAKLYPGTYYWTIVGSLAGYDISAKRRWAFTVDPPPPLAAPIILEPGDGELFDLERIRGMSSLRLRWEAVSGATNYDLDIRLEGGADPLLSLHDISRTEYLIEDLSLLDRGRLVWTLNAKSMEAGEQVRGGLAATSSFTIDLPAIQKPKTTTKAKVYGN